MDAIAMGKKLKVLRGTASADVVSKALKISRSALFMYERGERVPRDEVKVRIANYYNCSVAEIFFGD